MYMFIRYVYRTKTERETEKEHHNIVNIMSYIQDHTIAYIITNKQQPKIHCSSSGLLLT